MNTCIYCPNTPVLEDEETKTARCPRCGTQYEINYTWNPFRVGSWIKTLELKEE